LASGTKGPAKGMRPYAFKRSTCGNGCLGEGTARGEKSETGRKYGLDIARSTRNITAYGAIYERKGG